MLSQVTLQQPENNQLIIEDLSSLVIYVQSQNGSFPNRSNGCSKKRKTFGFNDPRLITLHNGSSSLYVDKYLECSIPDIQTEFLLESKGLSPEDYDAFLGRSDKHGVIGPEKFWVKICENEGVLSELVLPIISGGRYNPYVRLNSCKNSGSTQLHKILDLAGSNIEDIGEGPSLFNLMVFTFPEDVGLSLIDPKKRDKTLKKMWDCWKQFFKELRFLFGVDPSCLLGCNVSLHLWSSEFPFLPHPHFHVVLPHFSYLNVSKGYRLDLEDLLSNTYDELYSTDDKDVRTRLQLELSSELKKHLYFEQLDRQGPKTSNGFNLPVDIGLIRFMWSECVRESFGPTENDLDVFCEFVKHDNKPKLLHYLQYKNRPVILDLDLFFRKCPNFISGYHGKDIDYSKVVDFVRSCFVTSALREDVSSTKKYESILSKVEKIEKLFSNTDIFRWLQFLSTWRTDTRVYGFWQNIKRYRISSVTRGELPRYEVCPVCGGDLVSAGCNSGSMDVNYLIVNSRSKFFVFDVKGPPDPGGVLV